MLARVQSYVLQGIDALPCEVEVDYDIGSGAGAMGEDKSRTVTVGLPDTAVKESIERVRSAMGNSGYPNYGGRTLINLAPADIRKEGPLYDLPIAVGLLITQGVLKAHGGGRGGGAKVVVKSALEKHRLAAKSGERQAAEKKPFDPFEERGPGEQEFSEDGDGALAAGAEPLDPRQYLFAGELALDGRVRPVRGVIAMAALAKARGLRGVVVPVDNAPEAAVVPGVEAIGVSTLIELIGLIGGAIEPRPHPPADVAALLAASTATVDFADVRGQEAVKRAIVVACAGSHNLIRLGRSGGYGRRFPYRPVRHNLLRLGRSGGGGGSGMIAALDRGARAVLLGSGCGRDNTLRDSAEQPGTSRGGRVHLRRGGSRLFDDHCGPRG